MSNLLPCGRLIMLPPYAPCPKPCNPKRVGRYASLTPKTSTPRSCRIYHANGDDVPPFIIRFDCCQAHLLAHRLSNLRTSLSGLWERLSLTLHVCQLMISHHKDVSVAIYHKSAPHNISISARQHSLPTVLSLSTIASHVRLYSS